MSGAAPVNPLQPFLDRQGAVILDGGLATELEAWGYDLADPLWSARLLLEEPDAIRRVHTAYLAAGADCLITASYQASLPGFMARGLGEPQAMALLRLAATLANEARDAFWADPANRADRLRPIVAASIGPYGAYLADGSEYSGRYGLTVDELIDFHRPRWHILAETAVDLLACETIPSALEARAYARLLAETSGRVAWLSFSCRDGRHLYDGTPLAEVIAPLATLDQVVAVGVNCTAPRFIPSLITEVQRVTDKPIVVYPNSGERYDATGKHWHGENVPAEFGTFSREWRKAGAALIGGCCRTRPAHIRQIADRLRRPANLRSER